MRRFIFSSLLACVLAGYGVVHAKHSLSDAIQRIEVQNNLDPLAPKVLGEPRVSVSDLKSDLPESEDVSASSSFYRMSIKPGGSGDYPGATLQFDSPVDFSTHDVFALWFRTELPITYCSISLDGSDGVIATYNLHLAAAAPASHMEQGVWHKAYIPYKTGSREVRPTGKQMDFSRIKSITFYVYDDSLSPRHSVYDFYFGDLTLLSAEEAIARFPQTMRRPTVTTGAEISRDDECLVWTADAGEKIWKDTLLPNGSPPAPVAAASAAGNEYASLLFVVKPFRDLSGILAESSDLVCGDNRIAASHITLRHVDYVAGQFYDSPDPLPPMNRGSLNVRSGENFQLWTTVHVPARQPPGKYSGSIHLTDSQGLSKVLPVQVDVYDFALPTATHLQSMYTIQDLYGSGPKYMEQHSERYWGTHIEPFSKEYETVVRNIIRDHGEHRITPQLDIADWFNFLTTEERLALQKEYGFDPAFILGMNIANDYAAAEPMTPEKRSKLLERWKAIGESYKAAGLADLTIVKIDDEAAGERLKYSLMAAQDATEAMPFIQNFMTVTSRELPEAFFDYIDTWCPVWGHFDFETEQVAQRQAAGDRFWVYGVEYKYNYAYHPLDLRAPYWLYWKYGITGTHYSHGDDHAYLTYPNATYPHSDGLEPIPSIRWEMIRHGVQDYEYLWLLNDLIQKNPEKGEQYRELLEVPKSLAADPATHTRDPHQIRVQCERVAKAIEELSSGKDQSF